MAAAKRQDASMDTTLNGVTVDGKVVPWAVAFPRTANEPIAIPVVCECVACAPREQVAA